MFLMYPYSPVGDKRLGAPIRATDLGNRESNSSSSCFRVRQLEQIDMNAASVIEVDRPHEYVLSIISRFSVAAVRCMGLT
jgi:hypothetical protein